MIGLLGDHRGLPLLFGVITKSMPLTLITQFRGESDSCTTLYKEIKKKKKNLIRLLEILKKMSSKPLTTCMTPVSLITTLNRTTLS